MQKRLQQIYENIQNSTPLIHNITNYVTVNDCANIELAFGGRPIMADDIREIEEILSCASSLVINMGTPNPRTIESMKFASKIANEKHVPVILDPVGCGFTTLRRELSKDLITHHQFSVIRGNLSEILFLLSKDTTGKGVDVSAEDTLTGIDVVIDHAKTLAKELSCVVIVTGVDDVITDGCEVAICHSGHPMMSQVTGTGCMLSAMLGVSVGANPDDVFAASLYAMATMGLAGEKGAKHIQSHGLGTSTMRTMIIDNVSNSYAKEIIKEANYEIK